MARERNLLDAEVEWHKLQRAHEEFTKTAMELDWKGAWGLSRLVGVYLETSQRMIRDGFDPARSYPETSANELAHLGHVLSQVWGPALVGDLGPGRKGFFQGLFGDVARVSLRWLMPPRRAPGTPPLTGVVESSAIAAHPVGSLRATDYLAPEGEPAEVTRRHREARRKKGR